MMAGNTPMGDAWSGSRPDVGADRDQNHVADRCTRQRRTPAANTAQFLST
jgi:hypothetical protein